MGYELKLKKSEKRMKKLMILIGAFILMLVILPAFAVAEPMNPSTLLETPIIEKQNKETTPEDVEPANPISQWKYLNRQILCNSLEILKAILTSRGQELFVTGTKPPEYVPTDPFDVVVITRNPETFEYTILLVKTDQNLACVIASGTSMKTIDEMDQQE